MSKTFSLKHRLLSLVLSLCMVFGVLSVATVTSDAANWSATSATFYGIGDYTVVSGNVGYFSTSTYASAVSYYYLNSNRNSIKLSLTMYIAGGMSLNNGSYPTRIIYGSKTIQCGYDWDNKCFFISALPNIVTGGGDYGYSQTLYYDLSHLASEYEEGWFNLAFEITRTNIYIYLNGITIMSGSYSGWSNVADYNRIYYCLTDAVFYFDNYWYGGLSTSGTWSSLDYTTEDFANGRASAGASGGKWNQLFRENFAGELNFGNASVSGFSRSGSTNFKFLNYGQMTRQLADNIVSYDGSAFTYTAGKETILNALYNACKTAYASNNAYIANGDGWNIILARAVARMAASKWGQQNLAGLNPSSVQYTTAWDNTLKGYENTRDTTFASYSTTGIGWDGAHDVRGYIGYASNLTNARARYNELKAAADAEVTAQSLANNFATYVAKISPTSIGATATSATEAQITAMVNEEADIAAAESYYNTYVKPNARAVQLAATNYNTMTSARSQNNAADTENTRRQNLANTAINKISAITKTSLSTAAASCSDTELSNMIAQGTNISNAWAAYNACSGFTNRVTNASTLSSANTAYSDAVAENNSRETESTNVESLISAISPYTIGTASTATDTQLNSMIGEKADIDAARKAYNAIDSFSQARVSNYSNLTTAESQYTAAVNENSSRNTEAQNARDKINAITTKSLSQTSNMASLSYTELQNMVNSATQIGDAKKYYYETIDSYSRGRVEASYKTTLDTAVSHLSLAQTEKAARDAASPVVTQIDNLKGYLFSSHATAAQLTNIQSQATAISNARQAYNNLGSGSTAQARVTNIATLDQLEIDLAAAQTAQPIADTFTGSYGTVGKYPTVSYTDGLPSTSSIDSLSTFISQAESAYSAITNANAKTLVNASGYSAALAEAKTNLSTAQTIRAKAEQDAAAVEAKINALASVIQNDSNGIPTQASVNQLNTDIEAAKTAYNNLSPVGAKTLVSNYNKIATAEANAKDAQAKIDADAVNKKIAALPSVTYSDSLPVKSTIDSLKTAIAEIDGNISGLSGGAKSYVNTAALNAKKTELSNAETIYAADQLARTTANDFIAGLSFPAFSTPPTNSEISAYEKAISDARTDYSKLDETAPGASGLNRGAEYYAKSGFDSAIAAAEAELADAEAQRLAADFKEYTDLIVHNVAEATASTSDSKIASMIAEEDTNKILSNAKGFYDNNVSVNAKAVEYAASYLEKLTNAWTYLDTAREEKDRRLGVEIEGMINSLPANLTLGATKNQILAVYDAESDINDAYAKYTGADVTDNVKSYISDSAETKLGTLKNTDLPKVKTAKTEADKFIEKYGSEDAYPQLVYEDNNATTESIEALGLYLDESVTAWNELGNTPYAQPLAQEPYNTAYNAVKTEFDAAAVEYNAAQKASEFKALVDAIVYNVADAEAGTAYEVLLNMINEEDADHRITDAQACYNEIISDSSKDLILSKIDQAYISKLNDAPGHLETARTEKAARDAAAPVDERIANIEAYILESPITATQLKELLARENDISDIRSNYNDLDDLAKARVYNIAKLDSLETDLGIAKAADAAAEPVINAYGTVGKYPIVDAPDGLPATESIAALEGFIGNAKSDYNGIADPNGKLLVDDSGYVTSLADAEQRLAAAKAIRTKAETDAAAVDAMIEALSSVIEEDSDKIPTQESVDRLLLDIAAAEKAYDDLVPVGAKTLVEKYADIAVAKAAAEDAQAKIDANAVNKVIEALPTVNRVDMIPELESIDDLATAVAAVDASIEALSDAAKAYVNNTALSNKKSELRNARDDYELDQIARNTAEEFNETYLNFPAIDPANPTEESIDELGKAIEDARTAYNGLPLQAPGVVGANRSAQYYADEVYSYQTKLAAAQAELSKYLMNVEDVKTAGGTHFEQLDESGEIDVLSNESFTVCFTINTIDENTAFRFTPSLPYGTSLVLMDLTDGYSADKVYFSDSGVNGIDTVTLGSFISMNGTNAVSYGTNKIFQFCVKFPENHSDNAVYTVSLTSITNSALNIELAQAALTKPVGGIEATVPSVSDKTASATVNVSDVTPAKTDDTLTYAVAVELVDKSGNAVALPAVSENETPVTVDGNAALTANGSRAYFKTKSADDYAVQVNELLPGEYKLRFYLCMNTADAAHPEKESGTVFETESFTIGKKTAVKVEISSDDRFVLRGEETTFTVQLATEGPGNMGTPTVQWKAPDGTVYTDTVNVTVTVSGTTATVTVKSAAEIGTYKIKFVYGTAETDTSIIVYET